MPEGPECRHIAQSLAKFVSHKTIVSIEVLSGRFIKNMPQGLTLFIEQLPIKVIGAGVHGKFIYWLCKDETYIWSTLGMTGDWNPVLSSHSRVCFSFADNSKIYFNDQRNFGRIKFVRGRHRMLEKLSEYGPDILAEDIPDQIFIKRIKKKPNFEIARAMLEQSLISGVGNYIKSDSLWLARLDPRRLVKDISDGELANLNRCIKQVIRESYNSGNTLLSYYSDVSPETSSRKYLVYNQKTDPDGNIIQKHRAKDKRTTYWVPKLQK